MILNQFKKHVKIFRTDNGSEFFNNACGELFKTHGILHQSSCPYTPQQNGVVERRHRHLLETARAIKFQGNLPSKFWGCCVEAAAYILNRVPSTILKDKSPFEMLYGRAPSLSHLRVIGCLCYVTVMPRQDKFGARAVKCVFLGYGLYQKGYKVYDLAKEQVFISRDVMFHESCFPFLSKDYTEVHSITSDMSSSCILILLIIFHHLHNQFLVFLNFLILLLFLLLNHPLLVLILSLLLTYNQHPHFILLKLCLFLHLENLQDPSNLQSG